MPPLKRHYIIYDLETDGTDPSEGHEIVQIGATAVNYQDLEPHQLGDFQVILKPQHPEKATPKALEVIGDELWQKALTEGVHPKVGLRKFKEYIDKLNYQGAYWTSPIRVGFNICSFDNPFLEFWMKEYKVYGVKKDDTPWAYMSKDVLQQMTDLFGRDNLPNHRLDTFLNLMGIHRKSNVHDALEDVHLTKELFTRYMKFMQFQIRPRIKIDNEVIDKFAGEYRFLSNFYESKVKYEGLVYPSSEAAYQSAKTKDKEIREKFTKMTAAESKKEGRRLKSRSDWDKVKIQVMKDILEAKFKNSDLRKKLKETGNKTLVEGNTWGDTVWGVCDGKGQNNLGKILMEIRDTI